MSVLVVSWLRDRLARALIGPVLTGTFWFVVRRYFGGVHLGGPDTADCLKWADGAALGCAAGLLALDGWLAEPGSAGSPACSGPCVMVGAIGAGAAALLVTVGLPALPGTSLLTLGVGGALLATRFSILFGASAAEALVCSQLAAHVSSSETAQRQRWQLAAQFDESVRQSLVVRLWSVSVDGAAVALVGWSALRCARLVAATSVSNGQTPVWLLAALLPAFMPAGRVLVCRKPGALLHGAALAVYTQFVVHTVAVGPTALSWGDQMFAVAAPAFALLVLLTRRPIAAVDDENDDPFTDFAASLMVPATLTWFAVAHVLCSAGADSPGSETLSRSLTPAVLAAHALPWFPVAGLLKWACMAAASHYWVAINEFP